MKSLYIVKNGFEFEMPCYLNKGNSNNCLWHVEFTYGTANGYTKTFSFSLFPWNTLFHWNINKYNGHARFAAGCRLASVSFDWFDKKSLTIPNTVVG